MSATIGYATVGSNDLPRAKQFYDDLLGSAGILPLFEHPSGGRVYGRNGAIMIGVLGPFDKQRATIGNGSMIALRFDSRDEVTAFHRRWNSAAPTKARLVCAGPGGGSRTSAIWMATNFARISKLE